MQRITISLDDALLSLIDRLSARRGYASRSEAIRDILRDAQSRDAAEQQPDTPCVATLSYVYDHETRELAQRLTSAQHDHHDLSVATLHVHLDHAQCLEVAILKGTRARVTAFGDSLVAQRGVRLHQLHVVPAGVPHRHDHPPKNVRRRAAKPKASSR